MKTLPTLEELKEIGTECLTISYSYNLIGNYPEKPKKPKLKGECPTLIREYADQMEQYNILESEYKESVKEWRDYVNEFKYLQNELVKDMSGFNDIPEQYKSGLWYHVSKGREDDHYEIYCKLQEICSEVFGC